MENIVNILAEAGNEPCRVDPVLLHDMLLRLPAKMYLELYYMMQAEIEGQAHSIVLSDGE